MMNFASKVWRLIPYYFRLRIVRITQPKFTVSVVAIVFNEKDEVLVLDHFIRPGASWGLPGGFIERDEYPDKAIKRELKEETDLDLTDVSLVLVRTINRHIEMLFTAKTNGDVQLHASEIRDFGWFPPDQLPEGVSDNQRKMVSETVSRLA